MAIVARFFTANGTARSGNAPFMGARRYWPDHIYQKVHLMSQSSPRLNLPLIQGGQAQKHVTHNEAVEQLDLLVQLVVQDFVTETPPGTAVEGQAWVIGDSPTGDWAGRAGQIASWRGGGWLYVLAQTGWRAWGQAEGEIRVYDGANWAALSTAPPDLNNLAGVGVNASYDATNKLAVAADATLLNNDGAGHQLKINKAGTGDTASLLYQTGFSGRAEMGLAGNDDFSVKVSADGTGFTEALRVDAATGITTAAAVTGGVVDVAPDTVAILPTPSLAGAALITTFRAAPSSHPLVAQSGMFLYDTGASAALVSIGGGGGLENLGAAVLSGTDGTSGNSGLAAMTGGLQILNRTADVLSYNVTFLGGLAGR